MIPRSPSCITSCSNCSSSFPRQTASCSPAERPWWRAASPSDELLVDLAVDSPPLDAPTITAVGPTYPPRELAARKLLALFDRAEARDFVDVHRLSERFGLDDLLNLAAELDEGFTPALLAEMLSSHKRFTDNDFADLGAAPAGLRAWVEEWRSRLIDQG